MTIDDEGQGFTPKQKEELTQIMSQFLNSNGIDPKTANVQFSNQNSNSGSCLGAVGKWVAYLGVPPGVGVVTILLLPPQIDEAYNWYAEKSEIAFNQAYEVLGSIESEGGERDPHPSGSYIAHSALAATTTPEPPPESLNHPFHPSPPSGQPPRNMFG